ncbi:protein FAR1-RELATED SEQUENCE 5-like [Oryza brachyantha]|uniref:Protein FAR1-RELATED SEQUENCE n=1 Tax=Oryza brachyantha TaxID=4533 RepID=J3NC93_ORYBR|nr:protein FAR1-RELATED SEQUENCE 5-like [Oryza brachyantha]XP_040385631.1 protein FAR1-RELATED SEQUENCE 5-like [Oryza brachyantha]
MMMEGARTEGDELIADYVDCLMSLDSRPGQNDSLILEGAPPDVEAVSLNAVAEQDVMREFAPADADDPNEPVLGMTFESDEAAKMFYHEYARRLGFPFRVGRSRRSKGVEEVVIMKRFVCSREGVYKKKQPPSGEATSKRERMSMREGCNAMMEVVREKDHWVVSKLEKAHNHCLGLGTRVGYLRARGLPDASDKVTAMVSDGMTSLRQNILGEGGDGQGILDYLKKMQANDPGCTHAIQVDKNGCLMNVFWADSRAKAAYQHFGDAVTFDTTYKKSKYMMPFVTFSGVNHHLQTVMFGCAFLVEETESSFSWLFETWLAAMGGKAPGSLVTDQNRAMKAAIGKVFPNSFHRFCKWYILSRTKQKLCHAYSEHPALRDELESCVIGSETISTFEASWMSIIEKYDLRKNTWLQAIYNIRQKWVPLYMMDTFFAEISPTHKLETMNDFYKKYFNTKTTLEVFLNQLDLTMASRYENEAQADIDTWFEATTKTAWPIEKQAASTYTKAVFSKFQEEFTESLGYIIQKTEDGSISKFSIRKDEDNPSDVFCVTYNASSKMAKCSCKYFEFSGILCRHILGVFVIVDPRTLPPDYFLKRWTRNAKHDELSEDNNNSHHDATCQSTASRYNVLCANVIRCAEKGSVSKATYKAAKDILHKAYEEIISYERNPGRGLQRDAININEDITIDDERNLIF